MSCGAPTTLQPLAEADVRGQTVIEGTVAIENAPVSGAYVRLLDRTGEFVAEVPTGDTGQFRFFAAPGQWTLRALAPRVKPIEAAVSAEEGRVTEVQILL